MRFGAISINLDILQVLSSAADEALEVEEVAEKLQRKHPYAACGAALPQRWTV